MESQPNFHYQQLRDYLYHIPGENPGPFTLCGTNCVILGKGKERIMIDACDLPQRNEQFLVHFSAFLKDFSPVKITQIFVTHGHPDHFGGCSDIIETLKKHGQEEPPKILKMMDGNEVEVLILERYPNIKSQIISLSSDQTFKISLDSNEGKMGELRCIYTPGHTTDHMSFLVRELGSKDVMKGESLLFSGDLILGAPSTSVRDLQSYMNSLYLLRKEEFSLMCVPHSENLQPDSILVNGKEKLEAYIKYREDREKQVVSIFEASDEAVSREQLYEQIYGERNLEGGLVVAAYRNLDLQIQKLLKEGYIYEVSDGKYMKMSGNPKI